MRCGRRSCRRTSHAARMRGRCRDENTGRLHEGVSRFFEAFPGVPPCHSRSPPLRHARCTRRRRVRRRVLAAWRATGVVRTFLRPFEMCSTNADEPPVRSHACGAAIMCACCTATRCAPPSDAPHADSAAVRSTAMHRRRGSICDACRSPPSETWRRPTLLTAQQRRWRLCWNKSGSWRR